MYLYPTYDHSIYFLYFCSLVSREWYSIEFEQLTNCKATNLLTNLSSKFSRKTATLV